MADPREPLLDALEARVASEAALFDEIVARTISRDSYRLVAQQALHKLAEQHAEIERQRGTIADLREALRACRRVA